MQVEVTEQNIILYGLVQLTGNSAETMLEKAQQARDAGYVLTVDIPDNDDIDINAFDHGIDVGEPDPEKGPLGGDPYGEQEQINVVQGEVVESHTEE